LPVTERLKLFSGHSLRAELATSANVDERYIQKQLGHASPEMTRRYQRNRDRFRVNFPSIGDKPPASSRFASANLLLISPPEI